MNELKCIFEVMEPEFENGGVREPQIVVVYQELGTIVVTVYFTINIGIDKFEGSATSALGTVTLKCIGTSVSGAVTTSHSLRKVKYTFENAQGMASKFVFKYTTK